LGQIPLWESGIREFIQYLFWCLVLEAYIFINADPGMLWHITEAALKIEGVKMAHTVTGQFDVDGCATRDHSQLQVIEWRSANPDGNCHTA